jgi:outer membrane immunogenic protein
LAGSEILNHEEAIIVAYPNRSGRPYAGERAMQRPLLAVMLSIVAGHALAADMPMPAPSPPPTYMPVAPVYNWTGFYIGLNGGAAFGQSNWTDSNPALFPATGNFPVNGFLFGGTLGGSYQMGAFVAGIEADGDWAGVSGTTFNTSCGGVGCETNSNWLATVRGRAGYAWDRVLFYGSAGGAFANVQAAAGALPFSSSTHAGWTAGAGVEYAFAPNWTAKVEYLFVDLANASCGTNCDGGNGTTTTVSLYENVIRGGINFKFGW